jgi:pimeloyl-ACP methyl ester carboxylesterase
MMHFFMKRVFIHTLRVVGFVMGCLLLAQVVHAQPTYNAFTVTVTGKGKPIILIPGATCHGSEWEATVAHYKDRFQCHVLTLAGYAGTAPLPHGPYLATIQKQIEQYITNNKLQDVTLIGHSIGGYLSLCLASTMKEHLKQVVVVDALPFLAGTSNPLAPTGIDSAAAEKEVARYEAMTAAEMRNSQLQTAKFLCRDSTRWNTIADWGVASHRRTFAWTIHEMMRGDLRQSIAAIQVPVLVLAAFCEMPQYPMFTRQYVTDMFAAQYAKCTTCTVETATGNAKHFIMYDAPEWYFAAVDNFILKP